VHSLRDLARAPHPTLPSTGRIGERIVISPAGSGDQAGDNRTSPTRIVFLSDMPMDMQLDGYALISMPQAKLSEHRILRTQAAPPVGAPQFSDPRP
jgi:hypothetical protein